MLMVEMAALEEAQEAEMAVMMVPMAKIVGIMLLEAKAKELQREPLEKQLVKYTLAAEAAASDMEELAEEMVEVSELKDMTQLDMAVEVEGAHQPPIIPQVDAQVEKDIKALSN